MCGRFLMSEEALEEAEIIAEIPQWVQEQLKLGEIFPSNSALVLKQNSLKQPSLKASANSPVKPLEGTLMPFGFYSESMKKRIINARAETAARLRMFAGAVKHQRCVIVCAAFYEWDADKQKITFDLPNHPALYLAGIYIEDQFIILTTAANASMQPFHHRMPLVLDAVQAKNWVLNAEKSSEMLKMTPPELAHQFPDQPLSLF